MQRLQLKQQDTQLEFETLFSEINDGTWDDDETIISLILDQLQKLDNEDQLSVLKYLNSEYKTRSFLQNDNFQGGDLFDKEIVQIDHQSNYQNSLEKEDYEQIIQQMRSNEFCKENNIPKFVQQNITVIEKIGIKKADFVRFMDNQINQKQSIIFEDLKTMLQFIYFNPLHDPDQMIFEQTVGSLLRAQIFQFQLYIDHIQSTNQEGFEQFVIQTQQSQMKYDQHLIQCQQTKEQQFLFKLFTSDLRLNKQNIDKNLSELLELGNEQLQLQIIFSNLDKLLLTKINVDQFYFQVVWYFWSQYAKVFKICDEIKILEQSIFVKKIKEDKRPVLFKQSLSKMKKHNDEILTYFIHKQLYFTANSKEFLLEFQKYELYRNDQMNLFVQKKSLVQKYQDIANLLSSEEEFLLFWNQIKLIQLNSLQNFLKNNENSYSQFILFLWMNEIDNAFCYNARTLFLLENLTILQTIQQLELQLKEKSLQFLQDLFSIVSEYRLFNQSDRELVLKTFMRYNSFQDMKILLEFQNLQKFNNPFQETIQLFYNASVSQLEKIEFVFSKEQLLKTGMILLYFYLSNLNKRIRTLRIAFQKFFLIFNTESHPKLKCFRILFENIHSKILNQILLLNKKTPSLKTVQFTLLTLWCLSEKLMPEDFRIVLQNLKFFINQSFYQLPLILKLKEEKYDDLMIHKLIKFYYFKLTDDKQSLQETCQFLFLNYKQFYEIQFEQNNYFDIFYIKPGFLKRKTIQQQLPSNMQISLEQFNISLAELSEQEQLKIIIEWSNELRNKDRFLKLIPFFFNIIKRGETTKYFLDLIHNHQERPSIGHLNMKSLFQILLNNSNEELKVMLIKFWSKLNPVPLIYQNPDFSFVEFEEDVFLFNYNIFYIFQEGYTILNFSLSNKQNSIGKTQLINQTFYQMEKFETCDTCEINLNTIDIMFDFSFNRSRYLTIGDAHGYIPISILKKILPLFQLWIIQMDSELELQENFEQLQQLNDIIQVTNPKICFIVRNSKEILTKQFHKLIQKIQNQNINLHFVLDLTQRGLDKQVISNEMGKVSKFLFTKITETSQRCTKQGQSQFFNTLRNFNSSYYSNSLKVIRSHHELILDIDKKLADLIGKENGFYNSEAFPIRSIEYQIKCLRDEQVKDFSNAEQQSEKFEHCKQKIEQLELQITKSKPTQILFLFCKIFDQENFYILYLWFTDRIRIFNQEQTYQLQEENQKLNDEIQKIKKTKDISKKSIEQIENDQINAIKDQINRLRQNLEANLLLLSLRNIGIEIFWREIIQQQQLSQNQQLQMNPADIIFEMIQKGEPFEFLDGDQLKINSQFLKLLISKFEKKGEEKILVLSVLGPQSSGKSTILNKIFGCHFWTSVGRCTKGIYLQLLQIHNKEYFDNLFDYILLLDTEGLQNPNQQDPEFDKKIALFVLAVSDIILVNVKGDIHQQFRNLVEMCIYTLGQLKVHFSPLKQISWCFNQNNDVNNKAPFLEQIQSIASNLNAEFSKTCGEEQQIDYNDILEIRMENIQILGFSSYEKSWKINRAQVGFDDRDWRQQISNETFSQEAYNYGITIIKKFVEKIKTQNSDSCMPNLNCFISNIDSKWNSIQRLPDLLEFSELIYHQQNQFMKTQFENIIKSLDFTFTTQVQSEIFQEVQNYQRQSLEIFKEIQINIESAITQKLLVISKAAEAELNLIKQQHRISKKITVKYIRQLGNVINTELLQCKLLIYQEIENYERTYQERQGFAQIETFVQDLSSKPEQLKQYQQQGNLITQKFEQLWDNMINKQEQQQEKLFMDFSDNQFKSITSTFTEYTMKSQYQQDYYIFLQNNINKTNPNENQNEKLQIFEIFKKELTFNQFLGIGRSSKNLRFQDIFNQPIIQRMKNSSEKDLVQIKWFFYSKIFWTFIDKNTAQNYCQQLLFDDMCKIILLFKNKKVKFSKVQNFFAILTHFRIQYSQDKLDILIEQIRDPSIWSLSQKSQFEDLYIIFQKLIKTFEFYDGPLFMQDENFTADFFTTYSSLKALYISGCATNEQQITQQRNDLLLSSIIITEKIIIYPQDYDLKNYTYFLYISNQSHNAHFQNQFLSNFPSAFEKIMTDQQGWEKLYCSIYDIIKIEMIDNQKSKILKNSKHQLNHQQDGENLSDDDTTNYSTNLIKIIMSKIEQEIICYNKQFSNFGVILNDFGERCIYYYSLFIVWRFVCSQKWKIFEKQKQQLENTQKIQFLKFQADIQENKAEQSKLKAQILIKNIYEGFLEKFHQDQSLSAQQFIQQKQMSSNQLITKLDQELLYSYDPEKSSNLQVYKYLTDQQKYIEDYSLIFSQNLEIEVEKLYTEILQKETYQFLIQMKMNSDQIMHSLTQELKSKEYFIFSQTEKDNQDDKYYDQKLYFIVQSCLFGEQPQEVNQIDEQYRAIFQEINFQKIPKKIQVKFPQSSDQSIQILKYFINEISLQLDNKITNIGQIKLNIFNFNIKNKIDEARLRIRGCQFTCPMCKRKCDQDNDHLKHLCQNGHYYRGMNGVLIQNKPSLFTCEEIDDEAVITTSETKQERLWKEIKAIYPEWQFKSLQINEIELNKAKMKKVWNGGIGNLVCIKLNDIFARKDIYFEPKVEFEGQQQTFHEAIHYIFMLDDSGSMNGQRWDNIRRGAISCMMDLAKNPNAKVSVIIFNGSSRIVINCQQINISSQEKDIILQGGGTNFGSAFQSLKELLTNHKNKQFKRIVALFYTDGEGSYPTKEIQELIQIDKEIQSIVSFMACTEEANAPILSQIVTQLKQAHFQRVELKKSIQTEAVNKVWSEIVSSSFHKLKSC